MIVLSCIYYDYSFFYRLTDNSMKVVQTLEDTNELQDAILEAQRKSLSQQERLLESSSQLGIALDMSKDNVKDMLEEFRLAKAQYVFPLVQIIMFFFLYFCIFIFYF